MASTTIHTLSYKMVADTQNFTRGLISSKSEIAALKKLMGDTSPEEKAEKALEMLKKLYDNGKISAEKYSHATAQVEAELKQVQFAASTTGKAVAAVNNLFGKAASLTRSAGAQLSALAGSYLSVQQITSNISQQIQKIDNLQDLAEQLDSSASSLIRMQYALQRGGGLGAEEAADAIKTFSVNVSMANMGMGKALKIFEQMGFEADTLAALNFADPIEKIGLIADELAKIQEPADRLAAIVKIFGTGGGKMAAFFGGGGEAIAEMTKRAERFGLVVSDMDAAGIAEVVEKTEELADAWAGLGTVLAREIYPKLTELLRMMRGALQGSAFLNTNPEMGGQQPLTLMQRMKMNLGIKEAPIGVAGYDIIFGNEPTEEQKAAFNKGQAKRAMDVLALEAWNAPNIGGHLQKLIEIGERQLEQKENRNAVD